MKKENHNLTPIHPYIHTFTFTTSFASPVISRLYFYGTPPLPSTLSKSMLVYFIYSFGIWIVFDTMAQPLATKTRTAGWNSKTLPGATVPSGIWSSTRPLLAQ